MAYSSDAAAGKVVGFYVEAFGLRPDDASEEFAPVKLWQAAGVQCMVFLTEDDALASTFPWARGVATGGIFQWVSQDSAGNKSSFVLKLSDTGAAGPSTEIDLSSLTVNVDALEAQQSALAAQSEEIASVMEQGLSHADPEMEKSGQ
jgi:hypothetical protein